MVFGADKIAGWRSRRNPAPRSPLYVAIALLLLPVLYVGSYLALVVPDGIERERIVQAPVFPHGYLHEYSERYLAHYRVSGDWPSALYYPLENMDRRLRSWPESVEAPKHIRTIRDPNWGKS